MVKILEKLFSRQRKVKFQRNLAVSMATGILFYHNMFSYQARESSLVPAGFPTAQFLQKMFLWSLCCDWRSGVGFLCIVFREKIKFGDKSLFIPPSLSTHSLSSRKATNISTTLFPPIKTKASQITVSVENELFNPTARTGTRLDSLAC